MTMLTSANVIFCLKIAVAAVTVLLCGSLIALVYRNYRLHGRINTAFFILTFIALLTLEVIVRIIEPALFNDFTLGQRQALFIHLCFALPAAALLPVMLFTGLTGRGSLHLSLAVFFGLLWAGTVITGLFFL
jgi:hypothetical protein